MESEARLNQGDRVQQSWEEIYLNPGLADLLAKYNSGESLDPSEQIQFEAKELDHYLAQGTDSFAEAQSYFPKTSDYHLCNLKQDI